MCKSEHFRFGRNKFFISGTCFTNLTMLTIYEIVTKSRVLQFVVMAVRYETLKVVNKVNVIFIFSEFFDRFDNFFFEINHILQYID